MHPLVVLVYLAQNGSDSFVQKALIGQALLEGLGIWQEEDRDLCLRDAFCLAGMRSHLSSLRRDSVPCLPVYPQ